MTIKSFQPGAVFVECIVRCKQLSIKLLDESPASSSVRHFLLLVKYGSPFMLKREEQRKVTLKKKKSKIPSSLMC